MIKLQLGIYIWLFLCFKERYMCNLIAEGGKMKNFTKVFLILIVMTFSFLKASSINILNRSGKSVPLFVLKKKGYFKPGVQELVYDLKDHENLKLDMSLIYNDNIIIGPSVDYDFNYKTVMNRYFSDGEPNVKISNKNIDIE